MSKIKLRTCLFTLIILLLNACSELNLPGVVRAEPTPVQILLQPTHLTPRVVNTPTSIPTLTPTSTLQPTATDPILPTQTPGVQLVNQGPGSVICPILLYHHIETPKTKSPYYVTPEEFRAQMQALKSWGYTSIPATLLVKAITKGAKLPIRPVVISFDDGDASVYSQAFPIMQEFGFTGVNYIIANYVGTIGYMNVEQLQELAAAGWETGSHSMTHADLTKSIRAEWEMENSRIVLEKMLGVPIETFAYPFGKANTDLYDLLVNNYIAGMGLGVSVNQRRSDLYYLWRRPVELGASVQTFGSYLPWNTPPEQ